jgi:ubiquinone/menaquinone biosynthesis C-methylase UbiE
VSAGWPRSPGGGSSADEPHRDATAEHLPFPDAAFDTVVASLVLCTVADRAQALAEARRVLRPGGTLRFCEHVRADDPQLARWQDRLERPWGWLAGGCHPNRDVVAAITAAGFRMLELDRFDLQIMPLLVRPPVLGLAQRPASRPPRGRSTVSQA